jgi:transcriptional regulator with XRE-family HTH domain
MDIVLKLKELRRLSGHSQKEVAELSGIGEKTLSSFETGDRVGSMKLLQLFQLLQVYNVTPAEFFGGKVEEKLFAELERLSATELELIRELRSLDAKARTFFEERFLAMMRASQALPEPARLRAAV